MRAWIVATLLLTGCAGRRYEVCIQSDGGMGCMTHGLRREDAVHVGSAMASLGYDVVVEPKAVHPGRGSVNNGQTPAVAPAPEPEKTRL